MRTVFGILAFLSLFFVASIKEIRACLPKLTDDQMMAGAQFYEKYYTSTLSDFMKLHREGDIIDTNFLENIFFNTIFQYYTREFLNFDIKYDYLQNSSKSSLTFEDRMNFGQLSRTIGLSQMPIRQIIKTVVPQIKFLQEAIDIFKQNKLLKNLGAAYMRQKIVVEKIQDYTKAKGNEALMPLLLEHDRIATDLQTMIFHFMEQGYGQFIENFKAAQNDQQKIDAGKFLATFEPSFINQPYYKNIQSKLASFCQPMQILPAL